MTTSLTLTGLLTTSNWVTLGAIAVAAGAYYLVDRWEQYQDSKQEGSSSVGGGKQSDSNLLNTIMPGTSNAQSTPTLPPYIYTINNSPTLITTWTPLVTRDYTGSKTIHILTSRTNMMKLLQVRRVKASQQVGQAVADMLRNNITNQQKGNNS